MIAFTSSSTVENFLSLFPQEQRADGLRGVKIASIGPITSQTLRRRALAVDIEAREYTIASLVAAMVEGVATRG